jgi:hypothetical protein
MGILYNDTRVRTIGHLGRNIPIDTLLFGDELLSFEDNKQIFETVHNFILECGRFVQKHKNKQT